MRWLCVFVLGVVGCALMNGTSSRGELTNKARDLNDDLRWGRYDLVLPQMAPELRVRFNEALRVLGDDLDIMDFDVSGADVKKDKASVRVDLTWSLRSHGLVHKSVLVQRWEERKRQWLLVSQERVRGAPMPLADEPPPLVGPPPADGGGAANPDGGAGGAT